VARIVVRVVRVDAAGPRPRARMAAGLSLSLALRQIVASSQRRGILEATRAAHKEPRSATIPP
jgi:hypothetical protein